LPEKLVVTLYTTSSWDGIGRLGRSAVQPASMTKTDKRRQVPARLYFGRWSGVNAALRSRLAGATLMYGHH